MPTRRLSQAISEGDGISVIAHVSSLAEARASEADGAEALAIVAEVSGLRGATSLPILWCGDADWETARRAGADACISRATGDPTHDDALEVVVWVPDEQALETVLDETDPEVLLLGGPEENGVALEEAFDAVLDLLPDVPAGKLAIADVPVETREEVEALERAGIDAVLVRAGNVAALVGTAPPRV